MLTPLGQEIVDLVLDNLVKLKDHKWILSEGRYIRCPELKDELVKASEGRYDDPCVMFVCWIDKETNDNFHKLFDSNRIEAKDSIRLLVSATDKYKGYDVELRQKMLDILGLKEV